MAVRTIAAEEFEPEQAQGSATPPELTPPPMLTPPAKRTIKANEFEPEKPLSAQTATFQQPEVPAPSTTATPATPDVTRYESSMPFHELEQRRLNLIERPKKEVEEGLTSPKHQAEIAKQRAQQVSNVEELRQKTFDFYKSHGFDDEMAAALAGNATAMLQPAQRTTMSRDQVIKMGVKPPTDADYFEVQASRLGKIISVLPTTGPKPRTVFYAEPDGTYASVLLDPYSNQPVGSVNRNVTPPSFLLPHITQREGVYEDANGNPVVMRLETLRGIASQGATIPALAPPPQPATPGQPAAPSGPPVMTEEMIQGVLRGNPRFKTREEVIDTLGKFGYVLPGEGVGLGQTTPPTIAPPPPQQSRIQGATELPKTQPSPVFRPGAAKPQQADARSIREAGSQLHGTPDNPDFQALDRYADLADDPEARKRIGTVFHLIIDKMMPNDSSLEAKLPVIGIGGLLSMFANYVGLPAAVAKSEASQAAAALGAMTPREQQYIDRVFATMSSWPAARKLTSQGAYKFAAEALERDIPILGVNTNNTKQFYDKAASMEQTLVNGWGGISNQILTDRERNYILDKQKEYQRLAKETPTTAPETKTVNGVVYEKVTGGWRKKK